MDEEKGKFSVKEGRKGPPQELITILDIHTILSVGCCSLLLFSVVGVAHTHPHAHYDDDVWSVHQGETPEPLSCLEGGERIE